MKKILVVGAGVCGLTSAVQLAEFYNGTVQVTLTAERFSPDTTGDGSAGLWSPYLCNTKDANVLHWAERTHTFLMDLWRQGLAQDVGLALLPMLRLTSETSYENAGWLTIPYGGTRLTDKQLKALGTEYQKKFTDGVHFVSFTVDVHKLLPYLLRRFENAGGLVEQSRERLTESGLSEKLREYDVVVNCTGLGARDLVPGEVDVHPIRGQVNRVRAPWMYQVVLDDDDDGNYVIPNSESVILGGTHQYHNNNIEVSEDDHQFIMDGCQQLIPGMKHAPLLKRWVGLRPGRSSIRLETELQSNGRGIVHNYGHGGSGVTLCWGCATSVVGQVRHLLGNVGSKL